MRGRAKGLLTALVGAYFVGVMVGLGTVGYRQMTAEFNEKGQRR